MKRLVVWVGRGILALALLAGAGFLFALTFGGDDAKKNEGASSAAPIPVRMAMVTRRTFEDRLVIQGSARARNQAMVAPVIGGKLVALHVREGDMVEAGKTLLFEVESDTLRDNLEIARKNLDVAKNGLEERKLKREQTKVDFEKASIDLARFERLYEDGVVPLDTLELQQSRYRQLQAVVKLMDAEVALGENQVRQAEAALRIAEKSLEDTKTYAPVSGRVTLKLHEPGEIVGGGNPVVRIEDPADLEAVGSIPSSRAEQVVPGTTEVRVRTRGQELGTFKVTRVTPSVTPALRTVELRVDLPGAVTESLLPGAPLDLEVLFERRESLAAPAVAVLRRADQSILFTVEDGKAREVTVTPGREQDGWVEISGAGVNESLKVVVEGQNFLEEGRPVTLPAGAES
ncbi:MAG TPA: efflux RND transporter periplasmic adaptor subunit [Candidatus Hydrogenedentes bacterium]|nr:efflux RND transporter periplasmic adaptor subunit [Candidatus Hydrogenedentota bacterium]